MRRLNALKDALRPWRGYSQFSPQNSWYRSARDYFPAMIVSWEKSERVAWREGFNNQAGRSSTQYYDHSVLRRGCANCSDLRWECRCRSTGTIGGQKEISLFVAQLIGRPRTVRRESPLKMPSDLAWPNHVFVYVSNRRHVNRNFHVLTDLLYGVRYCEYTVNGTACKVRLKRVMVDIFLSTFESYLQVSNSYRRDLHRTGGGVSISFTT